MKKIIVGVLRNGVLTILGVFVYILGIMFYVFMIGVVYPALLFLIFGGMPLWLPIHLFMRKVLHLRGILEMSDGNIGLIINRESFQKIN